MLKLTSLALGLLTAISLIPSAQASSLPNYAHNNVINANIHSPLIASYSDHEYRQEDEHHHRQEVERRRQLELAREHEAHARWEAAHRHNKGEYNRDHNGNYDRRDDRH